MDTSEDNFIAFGTHGIPSETSVGLTLIKLNNPLPDNLPFNRLIYTEKLISIINKLSPSHMLIFSGLEYP